MTLQSTIKLLKSLPLLKRKHKIITAYSQIASSDQNIIHEDIIHTSLLIEMIETCLTVLTDEERFVIETHLIKNYTWLQIESLFEQQWGPEHMRSERTLKRMQKNALCKIADFMNNYEIEKYVLKTEQVAVQVSYKPK